jgi:hypothetical protein
LGRFVEVCRISPLVRRILEPLEAKFDTDVDACLASTVDRAAKLSFPADPGQEFVLRYRIIVEAAEDDRVVFIPRPPELISLAGLPKHTETLVYPDPPIGAEEQRLFEVVAPAVGSASAAISLGPVHISLPPEEVRQRSESLSGVAELIYLAEDGRVIPPDERQPRAPRQPTDDGWARGLTAMRDVVTGVSDPRVVLGGRSMASKAECRESRRRRSRLSGRVSRYFCSAGSAGASAT